MTADIRKLKTIRNDPKFNLNIPFLKYRRDIKNMHSFRQHFCMHSIDLDKDNKETTVREKNIWGRQSWAKAHEAAILLATAIRTKK